MDGKHNMGQWNLEFGKMGYMEYSPVSWNMESGKGNTNTEYGTRYMEYGILYIKNNDDVKGWREG